MRTTSGVSLPAKTAPRPASGSSPKPTTSQTRFARIVVTDDGGRYVVPDLPDADYQVWVRGYGLADSDKVGARPGDAVDLARPAGFRRRRSRRGLPGHCLVLDDAPAR